MSYGLPDHSNPVPSSKQEPSAPSSGGVGAYGVPAGKQPDLPSDYASTRTGKIDNFENAMMQDRRCRDIFCCILFILFWGGMVVVAIFGLRSGDPRKIVYPIDYEGNICGANNSPSRDFTNYPGIFWPKLVGFEVNTTFGICVNACPTNATTDPTEAICMYGFAPTSSNVAAGYCFNKYASQAVFYRCIPSFNTSYTQSALSFLNSPTELFNHALGDLGTAWWVLAISAGAALVASFIWLCLLRTPCCAPIVVWMSIILIFLVAIALDFFLWFTAFGVNPFSCVPGTGATISTCVNGVMDLGQQINSYVLLAFAAVLGAAIFIFFIVICCMCSRIRLAIQVIKEAAKAVSAMPSLIFFPLVIFVMLAALFVYWLFVLLYLASVPADGINVTFSGTTYNFVTNDQMKYVMLYHLFGLLWTMGWIFAIAYTTVAGAVGTWYFTYEGPDGDKNLPTFPVAAAFGRTLKYHLGSLAFGSLLVALVQLARVILAYLQKTLNKDGNRFVACLFACMQCCLSCFQRFLEFLTKNAYIEIALFGYSFCEGARTAMGLLLRNLLRTAAIDKVGDFIMFVGKLLVCAGAGFTCFMLLQYYLPHLQLYVIVVSVSVIIAYAVATAFFAVFSLAIDTIFLCFLEDIERHGPRDDTPGKKWYMSKDLQDFLLPEERNKNGGGGGGCCGCCC